MLELFILASNISLCIMFSITSYKDEISIQCIARC